MRLIQKRQWGGNFPGRATSADKVARYQEMLFDKGYFGPGVTYNQAVDGAWGKKTQAAYERMLAEQKANINTGTLAQIAQATTNIVRNPVQGTIDLALSTADKLGLPTNATNYLRDLNVSIPYRLSSAARAGWNTLTYGGNYSDNYRQALKDPSWFEEAFAIRPLPVTNSNYSKEELEILRKQSENGKHSITNADIRRVSKKYGSRGRLSKMFTPHKVVQLSIGQASGGNGQITDVYDVNTDNDKAKRDNAMYMNMALKNPGLNYETIRAVMPYINTADVTPDRFKIKSKIKFK